MDVIIERLYLLNETIGSISFNGKKLKTLELKDNGNLRFKSCIPEGRYKFTKEIHPRLGKVLRLHDVPGRDGILIHVANYISDLEGCIGVGKDYFDYKGTVAISHSRDSISELYESVGDDGYVVIKERSSFLAFCKFAVGSLLIGGVVNALFF